MRIYRPYHHVHVRMLFLVMVRGNPTEIGRSDSHLPCNIVATGTQEIHPLFRAVVTEPLRIFTSERYDESPYVSCVFVYFFADGREIYFHTFIGEQTV